MKNPASISTKKTLTRRRFIYGTAATTLSLGLWGGCSSSNHDCDVVVVGAGLAGLHTAHLIEKEGFSVQVVEASDRVGGRLRTARNADYHTELGGSEVGTLYGRVRGACERLNVGLHENRPNMLPMGLNIGGRNIAPEKWSIAPENLTTNEEREIAPYLLQNKLFFKWLPFEDPSVWLESKYHEHDISCADYMRQRGVSEAAIKLSNFDVNGPSMEQMSAMTIFRDLARLKLEGFRNPNKAQYGGQQPAKRAYVVGGSDVLPTAMAADLNRKVILKEPVVAVNQEKEYTETHLASGKKLKSRFVVVAAPFSGVKNIKFTPSLPPKQTEAVNDSMYSATTQFHFKVLRPYWEEDGLPASVWSDQIFERGFILKNQYGDHDGLIIWLNGDGASALNHLSIEAQEAAILKALETTRPSMKGALEPLFRYSWEKNIYVGGNKHVFGAGQVKSFAKEMGLPHGRVYFAGEHLRKTAPGMESAFETAEIAALGVLNKI